MKRHICCSFFLIIFVALNYFQTAKSADVPEILNYQGTLTDNTGQPITGTTEITFSLYDVASGGTASWSETQTVTLIDGKFSVVLGSTNPLNADLFTGETFLGIQVESGAEMAPRQKMTSVAYALKSLDVVNLPDSIPSGVIVMWYGSVDAIPEGWALCDGNNGTPNLTDRFVVGAGNTYSVDDEGGSATKDLSHTHIISSHTHTFSGQTGQGDRVTATYDGGSKTAQHTDHEHPFSGTTDSGGGGNTGSGGSSSQDILPPYYALCFIMKL